MDMLAQLASLAGAPRFETRPVASYADSKQIKREATKALMMEVINEGQGRGVAGNLAFVNAEVGDSFQPDPDRGCGGLVVPSLLTPPVEEERPEQMQMEASLSATLGLVPQ